MNENRFIGLMSGTSLDGIDGVLTVIDEANTLRLLAHASVAMPPPLRTKLLALNTQGENELHRAALAANALVDLYAQVVKRLLTATQLRPSNIAAIGAHGQTVRHRPELGYTWQLNNPARLAERTAITVVADFRSRDIAAGGQGAPLVPIFHQALLRAAAPPQEAPSQAVVNIGGIANITLLGSSQKTPNGNSQELHASGFDTGPGNALLDAWIDLHCGQPYDHDGAWAEGGKVLPLLLSAMLEESYFQKPPPKSTGRDLFDLNWVHRQMQRAARTPAQDVQATLLELTARTIAQALPDEGESFSALWVCGGGAHNKALMARLQTLLPQVRVQSTAALGIAPMQVEASAFAWLAAQCVRGELLPLHHTTGARGPRIYGAIYQAG